MSDYPTLEEMDINRVHEVAHYSLRSDGKARDVLKVFYKRKKGSVLPERKTFKFGRSARMVKDGSSKSGASEIYDISPFLQKALVELDTLVNKRNENVQTKEIILERLSLLEKDMKAATSEIIEMVEALK